MDLKIKAFLQLAALFKSRGYHLYLVGGSVRDYLLGLPLSDMDVVSEATPEMIIDFINVDQTFKNYGSLKYVDQHGIKFDITTLREESDYFDNRHPRHVRYVNDLTIDYKRRDFTINGLYMDANFQVIDYCFGHNDLKNKLIKMIGDPYIRIKEDPLRIIRAIRFSLMLNFNIDQKLFEAMEENKHLLNKISKQKIISELAKIDETKIDQEKKNKFFSQFAIASLLGVVK